MSKRIHIVRSCISTSMAAFLSFFLLLPGWVIAEETAIEGSSAEARGRILKVNGEVHIINASGESRKAGESRLIVREMDTIVTHKGGKAVVQFTDGALSVLNEKSSLRIEKTNWLSHLGGKIYFTFRKVFGEPRKVKSAFATIGIRGTTFIVYGEEEGEGVALQEGQVEVESPDEVYEIHRMKVLDDFEAFKKRAKDKQAALQKEYEGYRKQTMSEFIEYKKSFALESNRVIRFEGNKVVETGMDEKVKAEFDDFEAIAGEMLIDFRQQSKEHREKQD